MAERIKRRTKSPSQKKGEKKSNIKEKVMKSKYDSQQLSKIINSYGGIGSIIQTREGGSLLINDFPDWPCYKQKIFKKGELNPTYELNEDRLVLRLKREFFPGISGLFKIPQTDCKFGMTRLEDRNSAIAAEFFPKYFYCPKCRKLKHIDNWQVDKRKGNPTCGCNDFQKRLEQVRFVLVSESGQISDIPWEAFLDSQNNNQIEFNTPVNGNRKLTYGTSGSAESLSAITVNEKNGNENTFKGKNLGRLPEINFINQDGVEFKMQLRQSNSICYVKTISSIFIPTYAIPGYELIWIDNRINGWKEDGINWDMEKLWKSFKNSHSNSKTTREHIETYLVPARLEEMINEDEYRKAEFEYFLKPTEEENKELIIEPALNLNEFAINNLYNIKKLKLTTVQTGYCRVSPESNVIRVGNNNCKYFPGVEMYGEGILFEFSIKPFKEIPRSQIEKLIHSFSHVIMKELEFECGYSITTLKERLYFHFDNENKPIHLGVLVYALSGSDGSLGGLSSLFDNAQEIRQKNIFKIIKNAIIRAKDCPNDPICSTEEDQANNNTASCYACTLIPETSCEKFNKDLDRNLLNGFYIQIAI